MDAKTKAKIRAVIDSYRKNYPDEYKAVVKFISEKRQFLTNEFASTAGEHVIQRALYEIPETLDYLFLQALKGEELEQLKSIKGGRWFAKTFPEFALPNKI